MVLLQLRTGFLVLGFFANNKICSYLFFNNTAYDLLFPLKTMLKSPTPLPQLPFPGVQQSVLFVNYSRQKKINNNNPPQ